MGEDGSKDLKIAAHYPRRIKSGAFFREWTAAAAPVWNTNAPPTGSPLPLEAAHCPFSVQASRKTDAENPQVNR
jgi:hypothetical protein